MFEEQVTRRERDFGATDGRTASAARDLGFFLRDAGDRAASAAAFAKALKIDEGNLGPDSPQTLAGKITLASVSPPAPAEAMLRGALKSSGMNSRLAVPALSTLGDLRFAAGDQADAARCWSLALQHAELAFGAESDDAGKLLNSLSQVVDAKEAVALLERAVAMAQHIWGDQHPETATYELNLAKALRNAGRTAESIEMAKKSLAVFAATLGPQHPRVAAASELARAKADR